jgi:hypothetical protein
MQRKASRLKAMMIAFLSITLAIAICAGFYFFKIQQNEKYQNQLHFRELNNITVSLKNGISAFKEFIVQQNKALVSEVKTNFITTLDEKKLILDATQKLIIEQLQKNKDDERQQKILLTSSSSKESYFRDQIDQLTVGSYQMDYEFKQAVKTLYLDALSFLKEQVNEIKVLASVSSNKNSINSDAIKELDKHKVRVEDCLDRLFNSRNFDIQYSDCFDQSYKESIENVEYEINKTLNDQTKISSANTNVYNQNSPLRSISKVTTQQVGLAKLDTDNLTPETWGIEINDWLGGSNDLYPLILLVDHAGKLVAQKQSPDLNSSLVGITFSDVSSFLNEDIANSNDAKGLGAAKIYSTARGVSKFVDIMISGNEFRIFISPFSSVNLFKMTNTPDIDCGTKAAECDKAFYIIGLREKAKFNSTKQTISRSIVTAAILFTLALVAFIPLLKIRLSSVSQAFSAWDRHTLAIGCVLLVTVLSIGLFDYIYYSKVKSEQGELSDSLFIQMRNSFNLELNTLIDIAYKNLDKTTGDAFEIDTKIITEIQSEIIDAIHNGASTELQAEGSIDPNSLDDLEAIFEAKIRKYKLQTFKDYLLINDTSTPYFLENLFILNAGDTLEQSVKMDGLAMWGTTSRFRGLNKDISLLKREYATRGVQNQLWPVDIDQNTGYCEPGLYIERLFNLRDGAKSTQFSLSCQQKEGTNLYDSLSFGTQIQSFTNTIMPANFGFVVFDNKTGKALYHSQDEARSLVENVFVETDNSGLLKAYMETPYFYNQPTSFEVDYNGKVHSFTMGKLKEGVPWTLVVFYDKHNTRALNLMSILVTLSICFVVFVLVYYFMIMIVPKSKRRGVFWPTPSESNKKKNVTILVILSGAIVFFGGLSLIIASYVFDHHQLRYKQINNAHLGAKINAANSNIKDYRHKVLDPESVGEYKIDGAPCFLGTTEPIFIAKDGVQTCSLSKIDQSLDNVLKPTISYFTLLIESFWSFSVLDGSIDETLVITSKVNQKTIDNTTQKDMIDNSLNIHAFERKLDHDTLFDSQDEEDIKFGLKYFVFGLLIIIAFAAFGLVLFKITKEWIFERFFGFNIPPFFRLNEKTRYDVNQALNDHFFHKHQYMTIVRPKLETLHHIQNPDARINSSFDTVFIGAPLINDTVVELRSLFSDGESAEFAISKLIARTKQSHPLSQKFTLVLAGLENSAFDKDARIFALNFMERLLEQRNINVILLCEVAPLYRLTQSELYPSKHDTNPPSCASEMVRWSNILKPFVKVYDWCPNYKQRLRHDADAAATLIQEAIAWPELRAVLKQFMVFNKSAHPESAEAYGALLDDIETKETEPANASLLTRVHIDERFLGKTNINEAWIPEQIIEFFSANSGALYRFKWEQCTKTERIILYQIASGLEPNPLNRGPLEHLVRRGYICRDKGWFLVNTSFKEFVINAEPLETIERWLTVANESIWQYLRIPFFAIVITLVAIMAYTATDAIETAIGVLSAVFALIPLAIKNFSAIKTGTP